MDVRLVCSDLVDEVEALVRCFVEREPAHVVQGESYMLVGLGLF